MENEIKDVVRKYTELVNQPSQELFNDIFAQNCEVSLISITNVFQGREAVYDDFLIGGIQKAYSSIILVNDGLSVNVINSDLAVVIFKYHTECVRRETNEEYGIQGLETQVLLKEDGKWKIAHVHYSK